MHPGMLIRARSIFGLSGGLVTVSEGDVLLYLNHASSGSWLLVNGRIGRSSPKSDEIMFGSGFQKDDFAIDEIILAGDVSIAPPEWLDKEKCLAWKMWEKKHSK